MENEYEFRAFVNGKIIYHNDLQPYQYFLRDNVNAPIMQYIGLLDDQKTEEYPNGRKIFLGDIVTARDTEAHKFIVGEVVRRDDYYFYGVGSILFDELTEIKVIGNIWENPELIEIPKNRRSD